MPATRLSVTSFVTYSRAVIALLLLAGAAACGQKGPLYLPEPTPMVIGEDTSQTDSAQDDDKDENEDDARSAAPGPRP